MDKNELARRLMETFLEEVNDHVGSMNRDLLGLEKGASDDAELIKQLFRSAHSLKGASRAVDVPVMEAVCHKMEDIFGWLRSGDLQVSSELTSRLLEAVDCIETCAAKLQAGEKLDETASHSVVDNLSAYSIDESTRDDNDKATAESTARAPAVEEQVVEAEPAVAPIPAEPSPANVPVPSPPSRSVATTIRVPAEKLDALLAQSGEVLIARSRVEFRCEHAVQLKQTAAQLRADWQQLERELSQPNESRRVGATSADILEQARDRIQHLNRDLEQLVTGMASDSRLLSQSCATLDGEVYRVRMLPFAEACVGLDRAVRDIARATDKDVDLVIEGADVEVDRSVLEGLKDPLLHLVRNAVDHGIESAADRRASNKQATARITVAAALRGGQVEVLVRDDGQGLDLERICQKAKERGISVPDSPREQARLIFAPGFSTAPIVTDVSGRGVGLDVVQSQIESLHGAADVTFDETGTQFTLTVPLTLTTIRSMLASSSGETFAFPTSSISQVVRFQPSDLRQVSGDDTLLHDGQLVSVVPLARILSLPQTSSVKPDQHLLGLALTVNDQRLIVVVDDLVAEQDILVKNLGRRIRRVKQFSGATLLPTGRVALVVNVPNMIRRALMTVRGKSIRTKKLEAAVAKRLLVVDDSVTTRTLMKSILETAGYAVTSAADGRRAWEILQSQPFDLVVSDVDMPHMTGFELTETIRAVEEFRDLPVVLVTARGSNEDKTRGVRIGASAYIEKTGFDQRMLLDVVKQLA